MEFTTRARIDEMTYILDTNKIIELYQLGWSKQSLAQRFKVSSSVILRLLLANGVALRTISESVKQMLVVDSQMRDKTGAPTKYPVDINFFNTVTEQSAYILGLLQSDGYISNKRVVLCLKESDRDFLAKVAGILSPTRPLLRIKAELGICYSLDISSTKLARAIQRWGIRSPKYKITTINSVLKDSRDFWRGVIDGDGTLCIGREGNRKILSLVGTQCICDNFLRFCHQNNIGDKVAVRPHKSIFSVRVSNNGAYRMAEILYKNAILYLPRKYQAYQQWEA